MSGYWYLGSPYSRYPGGLEEAHRVVCVEAARLIEAGHAVFSPIAHTHAISVFGHLNSMDHDIWLPADQPLMDAAKGLIVLKMNGWSRSYGLAYETEVFAATQRPVIYMEPGAIPEGLT